MYQARVGARIEDERVGFDLYSITGVKREERSAGGPFNVLLPDHSVFDGVMWLKS
jgi:hypothetical protein